MKRLHNTSSKYTSRFVTSAGNSNYGVYHNFDDNPAKLVAQVSKLSPYDDADYYTAHFENQQAKFARNMKPVEFVEDYPVDEYADADSTSDDYLVAILPSIINKLKELNSNTEPRIIHS